MDARLNAPAPTPMARREFPSYIWGASIALLTAESVGALF